MNVQLTRGPAASIEVRRALAEGERRSLEACRRRPGDTRVDGTQEVEPLTPEVLWRRYKWPLVGLGLFLLIEFLSLGKLISKAGTHF